MLKEVEIEAFNPISGRVRFATLTIPEGWSITVTIYGVEVYSYSREDGLVRDGEAFHCLISPDGVAFDLKVSVKSGKKYRYPKNIKEIWETEVNGRTVKGLYGIKRTGFLKRRDKPTLILFIPCEKEERTLILEVSGPRLPEAVKLIYESLLYSRC